MKSYLVHYAYVETLQAYEDDTNGKKQEVAENSEEKTITSDGFAIPALPWTAMSKLSAFPGLTQTNFVGQARDRTMTFDR